MAQGTHSLPVSHPGSIPAVTLPLHRLREIKVIAEVEGVGAIEHLQQGLNFQQKNGKESRDEMERVSGWMKDVTNANHSTKMGCVCTTLYMYTCMYVRIRTHACVHAHTHTHTHTHTCTHIHQLIFSPVCPAPSVLCLFCPESTPTVHNKVEVTQCSQHNSSSMSGEISSKLFG